ncbi:WAP four-disulfide core domain protein 1 isoform X2 [Neofelis nebulosa]|uniref:WAP four-disulfide core domain protein 1 isoform X2 n=1 Tax=Neofelis nebulosa TaxID=61452 RepID=UPI00272CEA05|nr:WAP four-disulfide core domain protein 1 isoform X2 [Neofelis nebulosa]XP_058562423.1 WAP four-disulfide core domain protein 1 isoform X2 [Neofelis nebulosa]
METGGEDPFASQSPASKLRLSPDSDVPPGGAISPDPFTGPHLLLWAEEAGGPRQPRADRCPPPPRSLPPGACQAARCQADSECPRHRRCCYNGCAYACLEAVPPPPAEDTEAQRRRVACPRSHSRQRWECPLPYALSAGLWGPYSSIWAPMWESLTAWNILPRDTHTAPSDLCPEVVIFQGTSLSRNGKPSSSHSSPSFPCLIFLYSTVWNTVFYSLIDCSPHLKVSRIRQRSVCFLHCWTSPIYTRL